MSRGTSAGAGGSRDPFPRVHIHSGWGVHNLQWESFTGELVNNGGWEIYRFLSEAAVSMDGVCASVVPVLRVLNKTFKTTIDPLITAYMIRLNTVVAALQGSIKEIITHDNLKPTHGHRFSGVHVNVDPVALQAWNAWHARHATITNSIRDNLNRVEAKFGYHVSMTLKKCMSEHVNNQRGQGIYGWAPAATDKPRLGTTVHCFLAMAGKHTCELHGVKEHSARCMCATTIGGAFTYVPQGKGLIMHCDATCMNSNCVIINPSDGRAIVPRTRKDQQDEHMKEFAEAILLHTGVSAPFTRDSLRNRVGGDTWATYVHNPHAVLQARPGDASSAMRFLLLTHPSFELFIGAHASTRYVPTFQSLIHASGSMVRAATRHMASCDTVVEKLQALQAELLRKHAVAQIDDLLKRRGEKDGVSNLNLETASNLLPGTRELMDSVVVNAIAATPLDRLRSAHVLSRPFTSRILSAIVMALGSLRRYDATFSGSHASGFAYSYVTGLCAGKDMRFDHSELSVQLNIDVCDEDSIQCWRNLVTVLHIFDSIDYRSIKVVECPQEEIVPFMRDHNGGGLPRSGTILKWTIDIGGKRLSGPIIAKIDRDWYSNKKASGEALLASLGYEPEFIDIPTGRSFRALAQYGTEEDPRSPGRPTYASVNYSATQEFINWFQHTAQHLCARPETRAIGLDILTGDQPRSLIKIVGEADLDPECVASAAAVMQIDEAVEDAEDA